MEGSPSWPKEATVPDLAEIALAAEDVLQAYSDLPAGDEELVRDTRRLALDELVRRGAIPPYKLV